MMMRTRPDRRARFLTRAALAAVLVCLAGGTFDVPCAQAGSGDTSRSMLKEQLEENASVWGTIKLYTNDFILMTDGRRYHYAKPVRIDTYSLDPDRKGRGNVRVRLDAQGKATHVYFYGIDMPDVIKRYKR